MSFGLRISDNNLINCKYPMSTRIHLCYGGLMGNCNTCTVHQQYIRVYYMHRCINKILINFYCILPYQKMFKKVNGIYFLTYIPYIYIKGGLLNHLAICVSPPTQFFQFSMQSMLYQRKVGDLFFSQLLVVSWRVSCDMSHFDTFDKSLIWA
jgi:hypothetical protein